MTRSTSLRPNPVKVAFSALWALRVARPGRGDEGGVDHGGFRPVLDSLAAPGGLANVARDELTAYIGELAAVDPALLRPDAELAFWLNAYNAHAIALALDAHNDGLVSVLEVTSAFDRKAVAVKGSQLSLTDVEHGKIRRFKDPRVHAALVCGSLSCPTLRPEPFEGPRVSAQLEDQMQSFQRGGGVVVDRTHNTLRLSRIFLWFGADFARPSRMPALRPARRRDVGTAAVGYLDEETQRWFLEERPTIEFQSYDWGLGCSVA